MNDAEITFFVGTEKVATLAPGDSLRFASGDLLIYHTGKDAEVERLLMEIRQDEVNRVLAWRKGRR